LVVPGVIAAPLRNPEAREKIGFSPSDDVPVPVMAELNLQYGRSTRAAFQRAESLWRRVTDGARLPTRIADQYLAGELSMNEVECLVAADAVPMAWPARSIFRVWPDFPVALHVDVTRNTVKMDAAARTYDAFGEDIVWAVVDTGIDGDHPHFAGYQTLAHESVCDLHRTFPVNGEPIPGADALVDTDGHGTHVAGIIAGAVEPWLAQDRTARHLLATESRHNPENPAVPLRAPRPVADPRKLAGMAPRARLVSLKVLGGGGTLEGRVHRVIQALSYVREVNGDSPQSMRIHGVNLSIGYEFDPQWFACGSSPLCQEVDKLVRSGVVVVVAAGNSGFGTLNVTMAAPTQFGLGMTINDPGNSQLAITVGSTHRSQPTNYGVSYFSSKGPTGDGRNKPDLVAPGERITSCAAGENLAAVVGAAGPGDTAVYVEDTGTSMAAPHVSGVVAALLSVRRHLIGQPEDIKQVLLKTAQSLNRGKDFQGGGLLNANAALDQT
jgi:subtilisin family serine protease